MLTRKLLTSRVLALVSAATLATGLAACGEEDPIGPGIGFTETGRFTGTLNADSSRTLAGVVANRTGTMVVRACGSEGGNLDLFVTQGTATDTVGTVSTLQGCDQASVPVAEGRVYRFRIANEGTAATPYVVCWSYDADDCAGLAPVVPDTGGVPTGYYLTAEGLSGSQLLAALHNIVRTGHNGFEYDSARGFLYQDVEDPDDNNLIEDLYAGRVATVDRRANSTTDAGDANMNAEHAWPQSCGSRLDRTNGVRSTGPRGDLHIIFAADAPANTSRSNDPFGNIAGNPTASFGPDSAGNFSRKGSNGSVVVFEPRAEKKGDLARAIFYYYVRYVPQIPEQTSLANFNVEEATLLQWHQQDPPDAFERARNNEAYAVQGNRNPFIDRPQFLTAIGDFPNTVTGTAPTCSF